MKQENIYTEWPEPEHVFILISFLVSFLFVYAVIGSHPFERLLIFSILSFGISAGLLSVFCTSRTRSHSSGTGCRSGYNCTRYWCSCDIYIINKIYVGIILYSMLLAIGG